MGGGRARLTTGIMGLAAILVLLIGAATPAAADPLTITLPGPLPPFKLLSIMTGLHLVGLCFGLGGATMLDFWILRWMRWGGMPVEIGRMFEFMSKVVTAGIILLWLSGLAFLCIYWVESPEKLANPKIWAKMTVVAALTLNGILIHSLVLPKVLHDVGRPMLDGFSRASAGLFLVSGVVSGVSWATAFALGIFRELNGVVSAGAILAFWLVAVLAASLAASAGWYVLGRALAGRRAPFLPPLDGQPSGPPPAEAVPRRAAAMEIVTVPRMRGSAGRATA